jgi:hypothetical protein
VFYIYGVEYNYDKEEKGGWIKIAKLTFVLVMEFAISMLLWLTGIQPMAFTLFAGFVSGATLNSTNIGNLPNITSPNQTMIMGDVTTVNYSGSTFLFGILSAVGLTALISTIISVIASGFGVIYLLPAAMGVTLLVFLLSPITTIIGVLLVNQYTWAIGIILLTFFLTMTILGLLELIRGGEV